MPPSPLLRRVLGAAIAAIRPRGHGFDQPIDDDVLREVETFLPFLPAPMRLGFPLGLLLLEFGPPVLARRWARLTRMPVDQARAYLDGLSDAGGLRASLLLGLRTLVFLSFYQHPEVLAGMGIDWAGRAATLVHRRAALLDEHAA